MFQKYTFFSLNMKERKVRRLWKQQRIQFKNHKKLFEKKLAIDIANPTQKETTKSVTIQYVNKTSEANSNFLSRNINCQRAFRTSNSLRMF